MDICGREPGALRFRATGHLLPGSTFKIRGRSIFYWTTCELPLQSCHGRHPVHNKQKMKLNTLIISILSLGALVLPLQAQTTTGSSAPDTTPAKSKASGTVSAVDTSAKTVTVGADTFTDTDSSKIVKADGTDGTLDDVKTGEKVKVSYSTGDDGTKDILTLKIGGKGKGKGHAKGTPAS